MAKVYMSSTFSDLKECRERVYRVLHRMGHVVVAMEDDVATDQRPLDKCLQDIDSCDVYVGIFAWRYGYVPTRANPEGRSITELELRHARAAGKECLVFVIDENASWPRSLMDRGEAEDKVWKLRRELTEEKVVGWFKSPEDLAASVSAAVHVWQMRALGPAQPSAAKAPALPQPREVRHHALLACAGVDVPFAQQLAAQLKQYGRSLPVDPQALFAGQRADFKRLEANVRECHTALVLLSDPALVQLQQQADRTRRVLRMLHARTGHLIVLCRSQACLAQAAEWQPEQVIDASGWGSQPDVAQVAEVDRALAAGLRQGRTGTVGLPFLVAAMTAGEAQELAPGADLVTRKLTSESYERFRALTEGLTPYGAASWPDRYGPRREDWRPFSTSQTIGAVLGEVVSRLNEHASASLLERAIKLQHYPFDALVDRDDPLLDIYREISGTGCLVLVDELSMFHPALRAALMPLTGSKLVSLVTISPFDPYGVPENDILENELRRQLGDAFDRYTRDCDPLCELGVGSEQRLRRWFHGSLPEALRNLRAPGPDRNRLDQFRSGVKPPDPVDGLEMLFSEISS